jgi:hypothetical protein
MAAPQVRHADFLMALAIQSLYSKIGVTTRAGAALYALGRGLVQTM